MTGGDIELRVLVVLAVHSADLARIEPVGHDGPAIGVVAVDAGPRLGRRVAVVVNDGDGNGWAGLLSVGLAEQTARHIDRAIAEAQAEGRA